MHVTAILLAAGRGLRFAPRVSKPLFKIGSKPILIYSLLALSRHPDVKDIIVVANSLNKKKIIAKIKGCRIDKIRDVVLGGLRRQDSVRKGLQALDSRADYVLIHDAARPFIDKNIISSVINAAKKYGAATAGVALKFTVKQAQRVNPASARRGGVKRQNVIAAFVRKTLQRNDLWEIQTPQVFKTSLIVKAYKKFGGLNVTDDASLVEKLKKRVAIVSGSYFNIKITTGEDLAIASRIIKNKKY
jgi:2-C-methyl-D-erythritol 4-phosphate cytidylyltransferase